MIKGGVMAELDLVKIQNIASLMKLKDKEVLNIALTTFLGKRARPRCKDYKQVGRVTGASANIMMKGRSGSRGIPKRLENLFDTYEAELINSDLFKHSMILVEMTLNGIIEGEASASTRRKYLDALNNPNLIYLMLQLSIRMIAVSLKEQEIEIENMTLRHMITMIEKDKKHIKQIFIEAYNTNEMDNAIQEYYSILDKYFRKYLQQTLNITVEDAVQLGKEENLLTMVGEEEIEKYLNYFCEKIKLTIQNKFGHQLSLMPSNDLTL